MKNIERQKICVELQKKAWFKKTSKALRDELFELPADCDGFLLDLSTRPEEIGNIKTLRLRKLLRGEYILTPVFEVQSIQTLQKYTFEYASWKFGVYPGKCRGIIFLEDSGEIKYFVVRRSDRFALSRTIYDALGARYTVFGYDSVLEVSKKVIQNLSRVMQIKNLEYKKIIDLGIMHSDSGLTNVTTQLFAAIVDISGAEEKILREIRKSVFDVYKIRSEVDIFPINDLIGFANKTDDSFLLSTITRVISRGLLRNL